MIDAADFGAAGAADYGGGAALTAAALSFIASLKPVERQRYSEVQAAIVAAAKAARVPPAFALGLAYVESRWYRLAVNSLNMLGLFQVSSDAHRERFHWTGANASGWQDPAQNAAAGMAVLRDSGWGRKDLTHVLAAYGGFVTWLHDGTGPTPFGYIAAVKRAADGIFAARWTGQL